MEKEELEGMLEAVKDLKAEYYIGTREAWGYLKAVEKVYSAPKEVSELINKSVGESFHLTYRATPERVFGLHQVLNNILTDVDFMHDDVENEIRGTIYGDSLEEISDFFKIFSTDFQIFPDGEVSNRDLAERYARFFENANADLVKDDVDFGVAVDITLRREYTRGIGNVDEEKRDDFFEYVTDLRAELRNVDWEAALSKERLRKIERVKRRHELALLSTSAMVRRLARDKVDNRLEYRRAVLCKWISDAGVTNYERAAEIADERVKMREERLQKFIDFNDKTHADIERRMIEEAKFVKNALETDRNFVRAYLNS